MSHLNTLILIVFSFILQGCNHAVAELDTSVNPNDHSSLTGTNATATAETPESFKNGETTKLGIPSMSCVFSCFPNVKKHLEAMDGVESVELVAQAKDQEINDHRVQIKFKGMVKTADMETVLKNLNHTTLIWNAEQPVTK